jgi:creatinine amidohydrolase
MILGERTWREAQQQSDLVVVLTLAAFEQHGHHLPLLTDTLIGTEIARRAEAQLGDEALFLPTLWIGSSDHHLAFPGTLSLGAEVYVQVLEDMLASLIGGGFRRIFLLNAHGGNINPARMAMYNTHLWHRDKPDLWIAFSSWWQIAAPQIAQIEGLAAKTVTHACEQETSIILRLHPESVRMEKASGAVLPFDSAFYCPDESQPSRVEVVRTFDQLTVSGAIAHPEWATAEKGEALLSAASAEVVAFVREFARWEPFAPGTPEKGKDE